MQGQNKNKELNLKYKRKWGQNMYQVNNKLQILYLEIRDKR